MSAGYLRRCAGKRRHPDKGSAEAHRRSLARTGGRPLDKTNTYWCDQCLSWHVGGTGGVFRRKGRKR